MKKKSENPTTTIAVEKPTAEKLNKIKKYYDIPGDFIINFALFVLNTEEGKERFKKFLIEEKIKELEKK